VVVLVVKAVDVFSRRLAVPYRPLTVANPALSERGDLNTVYALETVGKIEIFDLDRVATGCYPGQLVSKQVS
jgi:hypothetical protein